MSVSLSLPNPVIFALSSGSFTAAYYALYGDRLSQDFEQRFCGSIGILNSKRDCARYTTWENPAHPNCLTGGFTPGCCARRVVVQVEHSAFVHQPDSWRTGLALRTALS